MSRRIDWKLFSEAVEAEFREEKSIRGASGLNHEVHGVAVDDKRNRILIVSKEPNPRFAAMLQADIQATVSDANVLVARPIPIDIATIARGILEPFGLAEITYEQIQAVLHREGGEHSIGELPLEVQAIVEKAVPTASIKSTDPMELFLGLAMQADQVPWRDLLDAFSESAKSGQIDFRSLLSRDNLELDLSAGVCPIPLYQFSDADFDLFSTPKKIDEKVDLLKSIGIFQYFFPAPDQLALGIIDNRNIGAAEVANLIPLAPKLGHPLGSPELVVNPVEFPEMLQALSDSGYIAEGEFGVELTEQGQLVRQSVKFRPREGLISKVLNRISVRFGLSPTDFL